MIGHILRNETRRLLRSRVALTLWLAFPLVIAAIEFAAFGGGGGGVPKAGLLILDRDRSFVSRFVSATFEREPLSGFFSITAIEDSSRIRRSFESGGSAGAAALVIPEGFQDSIFSGRTTSLILLENPLQTYGPQVAEAVLLTLVEVGNRALVEVKPAMARATAAGQAGGRLDRETFLDVSSSLFTAGERLKRLALLQDLDLTIERPRGRGPGGDAPEFFAYFFPGLLLFSLLFLAQSIEGRAMRDRFAGIHRRIAASPVRAAEFLAAEGLFTFLGAFASAILVLAVAVALFGIRLHAPGGVAILLAGFCLFAAGLVKFIFAGAKSQRAAATVGMVIVLLLSLLGGGFAPIALYPSGLARVAGWSPVGAASRGLVDLLALGRGTGDVIGPIAGVWGWALLMALLGLARRRRLREG